MTAVRTQDADAFIARPDPARPIILVFGPDAGLVRERADALLTSAVDDLADPFALVTLEGDALASDPARLVDEAQTIPLFGGRRAVRVKPTSRSLIPAVEALLAVAPPRDCRIVIEAGDLKRNAPLRVACEKAKHAAAIPCYADGEREIARLIDEEMRAAGLTPEADARSALVALLGGDRGASRSEIRKLALYAHGAGSVTLDDVMAVCADAASVALDDVADATFAGRLADLEKAYARARGDGESADNILRVALRQAVILHRALLAGGNPDAAFGRIMPPVHFRRALAVKAALAAWSAERLGRAIEQLGETVASIRTANGPADALGHRILLALTTSARRRG